MSDIDEDDSDSGISSDSDSDIIDTRRKTLAERKLQRLQLQAAVKKMKEDRKMIAAKKVAQKKLKENQLTQHLELLNSQRLARRSMFRRHQTELRRLGVSRESEDTRAQTTQEHIDRRRTARRGSSAVLQRVSISAP